MYWIKSLVLVLWLSCLTVTLPVWAEEAVVDASEDTKWVTPKAFDKLAPHPRLFVTAEDIERMVKGRGEAFASDYAAVEAAAKTGLVDAENPMADIVIWTRGLSIQGRLTALAIQWHRTKDRRYLEAALKNVDAMKAWMRPAVIELAEGQCIAGVAVAYDLLYNDLTPEQRTWMVEIAREHFMKPFLRTTAPGEAEKMVAGESRSWWQGIISNWNPVSISGGGLLALAMYEELPEAQTMIDRVNESYQPIFDYLQKTEGGWVEGLGYWNWSMHYMSLFLVSYERATGARHEGFRSPGFGKTLTFGTYFVPHGVACGFGDNQHGAFDSSLMLAARQLGDNDSLLRLQDHAFRMADGERIRKAKREAAASKTTGSADAAEAQPEGDKPVNIGYRTPQWLLIAPDPLEKGIEQQLDMVRHYPEQGWGMLADQWPNSTIYASVRGGEQGGAHTHEDLLSWHGVVGIESMIHNIWSAKGSSAAFGARDKDIYERRSESKNTLFIGGLPASRVKKGNPRVETKSFQLPTGPALRLDATKAFWLGQGSPKLVFRLFAVIDDKALLVLDRVVGRAGNAVEARAYTQKDTVFSENDVLLKGEFETARMTFAADRPAILRQASALMTLGSVTPPVMMRWQTLNAEKDVTLATLLSRGEGKVTLDIQSDENRIVVTATGDGWSHSVEVSPRLDLIQAVAPLPVQDAPVDASAASQIEGAD